MRNIFQLKTKHVALVPVDDHGLTLNADLNNAQVVFTTPSHQFPTTATMPIERRMALLKLAAARDFIIIEDDYEFETNYVNEPCPALKSLDDKGHVIYVGSLSKSLFPGLAARFHGGAEEAHCGSAGAAPPDGAPRAQQQSAHRRPVPLAWPS